MSALVSVVVPAFNAEHLIGEAIASIRIQRVRGPIELIVVDDGSTDHTAAAARAAGAEAIIVRESNGGIGAARNVGVNAATGTYLAFVDADDVWPAESLSRRLEALVGAGAEAAFGTVEQFGQGVPAEPPTLALLAGSMLIVRDAFLRVGLFDETVAVGEFIDWYARAQEAGIEVVTIDHLVLSRRIHGTNTGILRRDQKVDYARVLRRALERRREARRP